MDDKVLEKKVKNILLGGFNLTVITLTIMSASGSLSGFYVTDKMLKSDKSEVEVRKEWTRYDQENNQEKFLGLLSYPGRELAYYTHRY